MIPAYRAGRGALCSFGALTSRRFCIARSRPRTLDAVDGKGGVACAYARCERSRRRWCGSLVVAAAAAPVVCCAYRDADGETPTAAPAAAAPDGGWPRRYSRPTARRSSLYEPQIAELGRPEAADAARGGGVHRRRASNDGAARHDHRRGGHARVGRRAAGRFLQLQNPPVELSRRVRKSRRRRRRGDHSRACRSAERVIALDRVLAYRRRQHASVPRTSTASRPIRRSCSTARARRCSSTSTAIRSGVRFENNDLRFAVNTNWDLFEHRPSKTFYLRHETSWLKATGVSGPWTAAGTLPASFAKLPADDNWKEVRAALPGREVAASALPTRVRQHDAGRVDPAARRAAVRAGAAARKLLWVRNTESDVFRLGHDRAGVLPGRRALVLRARLRRARGRLPRSRCPPTSRKIPLEHERSRVLASVPGTVQAAEAVLLAQVPQTARVSKKDGQGAGRGLSGRARVPADRRPRVARATNTDKDIFKVGDLYYMCFQGVWFMSQSAERARGKSPARSRRRSTRSRSARRRTT